MYHRNTNKLTAKGRGAFYNYFWTTRAEWVWLINIYSKSTKVEHMISSDRI